MSKAFDNPYEAQSSGLKLMGLSYILLRSTSESIYAKRVRVIGLGRVSLVLTCLSTTFCRDRQASPPPRQRKVWISPGHLQAYKFSRQCSITTRRCGHRLL